MLAVSVLFADLGSTAASDLGKGSHKMEFEVAGINVSGIKPTRLVTAGLLTCTLKAKSATDEEEEVAAVNMVVQVDTEDGAPASKETPLESLIRSVFDPLA